MTAVNRFIDIYQIMDLLRHYAQFIEPGTLKHGHFVRFQLFNGKSLIIIFPSLLLTMPVSAANQQRLGVPDPGLLRASSISSAGAAAPAFRSRPILQSPHA
jgi:hypothetical protein